MPMTLSDYRPGLQAADIHGVRHPFVEAAISKATLRRIAPLVGLGHLADLPSAPCLSSRIETGLFIEPATLALVHAVEQAVAAQLGSEGRVVRCRVRRDGLVIELDPISLQAVRDGLDSTLRRTIAELVTRAGMQRLASFPARFGSPPTGSAAPFCGLPPTCPAGMAMTEFQLDSERTARIGFGEAVYCAGKSPNQIASILHSVPDTPLLLTRLDQHGSRTCPRTLQRDSTMIRYHARLGTASHERCGKAGM